MEVAITIDAMESFVKATCNLDGDGPQVFKVYKEIGALSVCTHPTLPIFKNSSKEASKSVACQADKCVKPAYQYFKEKFEVKLEPIVEAFKYAQFFLPSGNW